MQDFSIINLGKAIALASLLSAMAGCASAPKPDLRTQGDVSKQGKHALKPVDETVYRINNIHTPGEPVFLFASPTSLAKCHKAIMANDEPQKACASGIMAKVGDGDTGRATQCDNSNYAVCQIQIIRGEEPGTKGYIQWDWLAEIKHAPRS